jgi:hypothetical protein
MAMNFIATDFNLLHKEIRKLQTEYKCKICKQRYESLWCKADEATCLFCTHFHPAKHTRHTILRESEWHFIQSGEDSRKDFNQKYIHHLHKWCNHYHLPYTSADMQVEDELLEL